MFMSIMSMSTMCMNGRGCVAFRGEEKDGTEEEVMLTSGRTNKQTSEDRATQSIATAWRLSFAISHTAFH